MALFTEAELETWARTTMDTDVYTLIHEQVLTYLEDAAGVKLSEQADVTVTYTPRWDDQWIDLPVPTTAVASVSVDGSALAASDYQFHTDSYRLYRRIGWGGARWLADDRFSYTSRYIEDDYAEVAVEMTYGFATVPPIFKTWGLVLGTQAVKLAPNVGRQSVRIDDFSETMFTGGGLVVAGIELPPKVLGQLRNKYRGGASVVAAR